MGSGVAVGGKVLGFLVVRGKWFKGAVASEQRETGVTSQAQNDR